MQYLMLNELFYNPAPLTVYTSRPEPDTIPLISEIEFFHFALDIARALEFLASQMYIHRDIAARNCLGEVLLVHPVHML